AALQEKGAVQEYPLQLRRKNGDILEVETAVTVQYDENGMAQNYLGIVHDVTAQKQAIAAMQERQETAYTFQQKLQTLQRVTTLLDQTESLDDLYRQAVEMGHADLGFERVGLLLYDDHTGFMQGTYGINERVL
ncbi:MAG: PAS domain S-box protein, partial [Anaerolineae bacterium]|nr:PAS domain S-box protein [Anaerolineae bacterium]